MYCADALSISREQSRFPHSKLHTVQDSGLFQNMYGYPRSGRSRCGIALLGWSGGEISTAQYWLNKSWHKQYCREVTVGAPNFMQNRYYHT